jgi:hypothetical protein
VLCFLEVCVGIVVPVLAACVGIVVPVLAAVTLFEVARFEVITTVLLVVFWEFDAVSLGK